MVLALAVAGCVILGGLSGLLSGSGTSSWYDSLETSSLTPAPWVFGVIWPVLYALMGLSAWIIWRLPDDPARTHGLALFVVQFVVNLAWSPVFFGAQLVGLALMLAGLLFVLVALTIWRFYGLSRFAAVLLLPYLIWSGFAFYLTFFIWMNNPS